MHAMCNFIILSIDKCFDFYISAFNQFINTDTHMHIYIIVKVLVWDIVVLKEVETFERRTSINLTSSV